MATPATKADLCKRGIPSIDLSDAVALTFAEPGGESPSDRGELRFALLGKDRDLVGFKAPLNYPKNYNA